MKTKVNAWFNSKINYIATAVLVSNIFGILGYLPPEIENFLMMGANAATAALIIVFRTWFTEPKK